MRRSVLGLFVVPLVAFACSSRTSSDSTVQGKLTLSSYGEPPRVVSAIDESGERSNEVVAPDGSFRFELPPGHVYRLVVVTSAGDEPVVFPRNVRSRDERRLDTTFRVDSGGAVVDLGRVQHYDRAPTHLASGGSSSTGSISTRTSRHDDLSRHFDRCDHDRSPFGIGFGHCVDDDPRTTCRDGSKHECIGGKHGGRCEDDAREHDADPSRPMSVPERNAPNVVGGCADDHDRDD